MNISHVAKPGCLYTVRLSGLSSQEKNDHVAIMPGVAFPLCVLYDLWH